MLRCHRNHSAFNSHNLPSDLHYYLPALFFACRGQLVAAAGFGTYLVASGCTYGLVTVSFHSISFEVYFAAVSAQGFARPLAGLLATHLAIVYSVYSAYLPGLHSARPSAFVEGEGFEPPLTGVRAHLSLRHSANLPFYRAMRFCRKDNHLNTFKSSYIPLAIFSAISC